MTCEQAAELAGLYVLDALDAAESAAVRDHLASCARDHGEFAELGSVVPAMAELFEPLDAPPELKDRVLTAVAGEPRHPAGPARPTAESIADAWRPVAATSDPLALASSSKARRPRPYLGWVFATAAILLIAVLGAWNVLLQGRVGEADQRARLVAQAIALSDSPGAEVARLTGTGTAAGATGFAAFAADGSGYVLVVGLPQAPTGRTYQAWYMADGQATSAALMEVAPDGSAVIAIPARPGTDTIALTVEQAGGAQQPSSAPIVTGELTA